MNNQHPIKKRHEPLPHDPRNEPIPESDQKGRSKEGAEKEARKEEGVGMKGPGNQLAQDNAVTEDEYGIPTGIPARRNTAGPLASPAPLK